MFCKLLIYLAAVSDHAKLFVTFCSANSGKRTFLSTEGGGDTISGLTGLSTGFGKKSKKSYGYSDR